MFVDFHAQQMSIMVVSGSLKLSGRRFSVKIPGVQAIQHGKGSFLSVKCLQGHDFTHTFSVSNKSTATIKDGYRPISQLCLCDEMSRWQVTQTVS